MRLQADVHTNFVRALIAAEDHRFYRHSGVDGRALLRAALGIATRTKLGGGSTIEQQLYRTLSGRRGRSIRRKLRELLGAWGLKRYLTKGETAAAYLLVAYYGATMTGLEEACLRLGVSYCTPTKEEAAAVVARLKYPDCHRNRTDQLRRVEVRTVYILDRMEKLWATIDP